MMMKRKNKKAASSNGKHPKARKLTSTGNSSPEWEHLEERFHNLSSEFNGLAEKIERDH